MAYLAPAEHRRSPCWKRPTRAKPRSLQGRHDLVLVIRPDYAERFHAGEINALTLIHDGAKLGSSRRQFAQVRDMINRYARTLGLLRLQVRGIDPAITTPLVVQEVDTASPAARALSVLATLPYLLVLVIFMGGFYLAIDTTAGEREHGSLEPLLSQPISRSNLVLGKLFATSLFSAASLLLFLISLAISIPFVPLHRIGMSLDIGAATAAAMFCSLCAADGVRRSTAHRIRLLRQELQGGSDLSHADHSGADLAADHHPAAGCEGIDRSDDGAVSEPGDPDRTADRG